MSSYNVIILASFENTLIVEKTRKVQFISRLVIERDDGAPWSCDVLMGTGSSICYSDTDVAEYSPAYLGQIYAGVVLNSARTNSSTGYASTLSLNSLYASTLSLNSLKSRKNSLSGNVNIFQDFYSFELS